MKESKVTKTMYETIDGQRFETESEATQHELNLEYNKDIISFATRIEKMCNKYYNTTDDICHSDCPFKIGEFCCLNDFPCNWNTSRMTNESPLNWGFYYLI